MNYTAVIQAGGKGTRMLELTKDKIPKPLLELNGKPMIQWQIENLLSYGIKDFIIITGHLGEKISEYFNDGSDFGIHISYIKEEMPLGSAGALYYLNELSVDNDIILIFGDVMFDIDWNRMLSYHKEKNGIATLLAHPNSHPYDSDVLVLGDNNLVKDILPKNTERDFWYNNCVNAGIYILKNEILNDFRQPEKLDLEKDILLPRIKSDSVYAYCTPEYVKDTGTPERYFTSCKEQENGVWRNKCLKSKQKCIFLDRDGTVNVYKGLISSENQIELEADVVEAVKLINQSGYLAILVTNQPVVARGMCEIEDVNEMHRKIQTLLGRKGAYLDDIVFCPHHPDKGYPEENPLYKIKCNCRKPAVGMIEEMVSKYNIDIHKSWMIGDTTVDIQTGINAGLNTALVQTGQAGKDGKFDVTADIAADNLLSAVMKIIKNNM